MIAAQCSANRLHCTGNKTTDGRVLPAKFSPSRVVRPSGFFVSGSLLSVLRPRLTPATARGQCLTFAPAVSDGARLQVSLSKNVNSRCTTGPFISGTEHRTALCGASLSAPSTLLKSCRDAMLIAQGKRGTSAALGYGRKINPSPFSWFSAPAGPARPTREKGGVGNGGGAFYPGRRPRRPCPGLLSRCPSGAPNFDRRLPSHPPSLKLRRDGRNLAIPQ